MARSARYWKAGGDPRRQRHRKTIKKGNMDASKTDKPLSREEMARLLNDDLAREYQAIIAYVVYSQTLKGAAYTDIARELEKHAGEELNHAILIAKQID